MVKSRVLMLTGVTLCCAVAIGVSMQPQILSSARASLFGTSPSGDARPVAQNVASVLPEDPDAPVLLENITLTSASQFFPQDSGFDALKVADCSLELSAELQENAMVALELAAPCAPNVAAKIHHNGMIFKTLLDDQGLTRLSLPALNQNSVFIVEVGSEYRDTAVIQVPDVAKFDRVVLQWEGHGGFELHAREFGAAYGEDGHIWSGAEQSGVGSVYRLGDPDAFSPMFAEVYSFPKDANGPNGQVQLTVEAEVSAGNCNRTIAAQTLDLRGGVLQGRDLVLNMPACNAVGDFLVLNNLVENLTIASK